MGEAIIRAATLRDAERIYALISLNRDMLVPRSLGNVVESIDRFALAECDGEMVGCAAYQIHPEIGDAEAATVEIVSVAVKSAFRRRGIGRLLVEAVVERARRFVGGRGAWMGFFAFLPIIGTAICILLGLMRANPYISALSIFLGKVVRYLLVAYTSMQIF